MKAAELRALLREFLEAHPRVVEVRQKKSLFVKTMDGTIFQVAIEAREPWENDYPEGTS